MTKFEQLIQKLCPNGVEFKRLSECCHLEKGSTPIQKAIPGEYPLVVTTEERKSSNTYQFDAPTVCIPLVSSRGHGVASLNQVYYQDGKFALGNILCGVTPLDHSKLSACFLYHYLNYKKDTLLVPLMKGGANVSLTVDSLRLAKVPVPPIEVQNKIVSMLGNFMALSSELKVELTARKKQYDYYCKQVFQNAPAENFVPIRDLGEWTGGCTPSMSKSAYWENGTIPWISSKDMKSATLADTQDHITPKALGETSIRLLPADTVAIVVRSGILKHTLPVAYIPFETTINQDIKALAVNKYVLPRYAYFAIYTYRKEILKKTKKQGGTVDSLDVNAFMNCKVPLLSIEEQQRVVSVLDRFDTLCNDLTSGLPAEIVARERQYEYYRDKLLAFPER